MNKLKYILLPLLLSTSALAQNIDMPKFDLPTPGKAVNNSEADLLLEAPATDEKKSEETATKAAPAVPAVVAAPVQNEKDKAILDKAINEVFKEPVKEGKDAKPKNEPSKAEATPPANEVPEGLGLDEDAAPLEEALLPTEQKIEPQPEPVKPEVIATPVVNTEPKKEKVEEVKVVAPVKPAETTKPEQPAKTAVTPIAVPAPEQKSNETDKPLVVEAPKVPEVKTEIKAEPKDLEDGKSAKKKVVLPAQTPKSLRKSYQDVGFESDNKAPAATPKKHRSSSDNLPPNVYLINDLVQKKTSKKKVDKEIETPKSMKPLSGIPDENSGLDTKIEELSKPIEQDIQLDTDLAQIKKLPGKEQKVTVREDIVIDRGDFTNPFETKTEEKTDNKADEKLDDSLTDVDASKQPATKDAGTPVVDFSENGSAEEAKKESPEKIEPENFYMKDSSLEVEVKDAPKTSLDEMSNAYDALKVGQYESAIKYYKEALDITPKNKKAMFGLATAYHMNKQYDDAKEVYLKIIKIDPNYWPAVNNYIMLVTDENPEKSIDRLEELYARNPTFAAIPAQLGNLLFKKGELQKSAEYYTEAVKLEPKNIEYRYNLAVIMEKTSNYDDAAVLYKSLLDDAAAGAELPEDPNAIKERFDEIVSKNRK